MKIIHLGEVLESIVKDPTPFSITYVKYDESRKQGGDIMKLDNVMLSFHKGKANDLGFEMPQTLTDKKKKPSHYEHATRNVLLENGMIRKFHIRLLLEFNGKKVFY